MAIWDAFLFNDELNLLEVRLRHLAGTVDHVLVVEGTTTFSGLPKPLHFAGADLDLSWFPGTVHSSVVALPAEPAEPWDRENAQRRALGDYLRQHSDPADLLLIGDVDELPRPGVLRRLERTLDAPVRLRMVDSLYWANWHQPRPWALGPMVAKRPGLDHPSIRSILGERLRETDAFVEEFVPDGGWHLSFLGGPDAIASKLGAYAHQELNTEATRQRDFLGRCLRYGVHFAGWTRVRRRGLSELDLELSALAASAPELFDLETRRTPLRGLVWCGWAWLRPRLPAAVVRTADAQPWLVIVVAGPVLALVQLVREARQRRQPEPRWPPGKVFRRSSA